MKIKINTKKIKTLNPCQKFLYNWLSHYKNWSGDILEFLALPDEIVTYTDKLCVGLRVVPLDIVEYFAIDMVMDATYAAGAANDADCAANAAIYVVYTANCAVDTTACAAAVNAANAADAARYATYAAYAAAIAAHYATYAAAHAAGAADADDYAAYEKQKQKALDTLAYLIATH